MAAVNGNDLTVFIEQQKIEKAELEKKISELQAQLAEKEAEIELKYKGRVVSKFKVV